VGGKSTAHISTAKRLLLRSKKRKITAPGFPFVTYFHKDGTDQAQAGGLIGEDADHTGTPTRVFIVFGL
jgi:hypothetical protein